jgi:hypothetical protein
MGYGVFPAITSNKNQYRPDNVFRLIQALTAGKSMKEILFLSIISLVILIAVHRTYVFSGNTGFPEWVNEMQSKINQTFHIHAKTSSVREPDRIKPNEYFSFCIQGNGYLHEVSDPFEAMEKLFLSDGWKTIERYQADGHESSSFAYEKEKHFCLISVAIDSACDDEGEGHVPSKFWFEVYCREKDNNQTEGLRKHK